MARSPEKRREIADEFRTKFINRPGRKATQGALGAKFDEVPERAPRNKGVFHLHIDKWERFVRVSMTAQADFANAAHQDTRKEAAYRRIIEEIENRSGQLAVLDANVFLHGVSSREPQWQCAAIVAMVETNQLVPCVSPAVMRELSRVGRRMEMEGELTSEDHQRLTGLTALAINTAFLPTVLVAEETQALPADLSDWKYFIVAARMRRYSGGEPVPLVTMDGHLRNAPEEAKGEVDVMAPGEFLEWMKGR